MTGVRPGSSSSRSNTLSSHRAIAPGQGPLLAVRARIRPARRPREGVALQRQARADRGERSGGPARRVVGSGDRMGGLSRASSPSTTWRPRSADGASRSQSHAVGSRDEQPSVVRRSRRWGLVSARWTSGSGRALTPVGRVEHQKKEGQGRRHGGADAVPSTSNATHVRGVAGLNGSSHRAIACHAIMDTPEPVRVRRIRAVGRRDNHLMRGGKRERVPAGRPDQTTTGRENDPPVPSGSMTTRTRARSPRRDECRPVTRRVARST